MTCSKCSNTARVLKVHDRDNENFVCFLCDTCQRFPEYHVECPHCDARILVN